MKTVYFVAQISVPEDEELSDITLTAELALTRVQDWVCVGGITYPKDGHSMDEGFEKLLANTNSWPNTQVESGCKEAQ